MKDLFVKKDERTDLEKQYDEAVTLLRTKKPGTDDYKKQMAEVKELSELLDAQHEREKTTTISKEAIFQAVVGTITTFGSILVIRDYEKVGNWTSKAMNWIKKPR